jgi:hypothetical protein
VTNESDRTFIAGNRNPWKYGWSLRACNGDAPDPALLSHAAALLGREPFFTDAAGFECEIIAAAVHPDERRIVYVESRAKERRGFVDITIKIHYVNSDGHDKAVDIESYNPFFGCDVGLIEWFSDQLALLVYQEKHSTFVYRIGDGWPPQFAKIDDRWQIKDDILSFMAYRADTVQRLRVPSLEPIPDVPVAEAESLGQVPPDPYAC